MTTTETILCAIRALRFDQPGGEALSAIPHTAFPALLAETDRSHLTLALGVRCREFLPENVIRRIDGCLARNRIRYERLVDRYLEVANKLHSRQIPFIVLKGLTHWPWYCDGPWHRPQSDIDLYCSRESIGPAREALQELGYEAVWPRNASPADHLPVMIRRDGWVWRNDYFDPDMPHAIEIHFRFWDADTEGFQVGALDEFWERRVVRKLEGIDIPALQLCDGLTYATLHLVRHLFRGDAQPRHVYELAHFLDRSASQDEFWREWRTSVPPRCLLPAGIAFRLAVEWFGPRLHPAAREALGVLPHKVERWFRLFALSPLFVETQAHKNELWLQLSVIDQQSIRGKILVRRLLPYRRNRFLLHAHVPPGDIDLPLRVRRALTWTCFLMRRVFWHARALPAVLKSGWDWFTVRE